MKPYALICATLAIVCLACQPQSSEENWEVTSPEETLSLHFMLTQKGAPAYTLKRGDIVVLDTSVIGGFSFRDQPDLGAGLSVTSSRTNSFSETWEMPWGEQRTVDNSYNELAVDLREAQEPGRSFTITFRVFEDGIGFRYEFPEQEGLEEVVITDEHTHFALTGDHTTWWIPGDWDIYEHLYNTTAFTEIDAISKRDHPNLAQTYIPENAVNTPVTMRTADGLHLSFHEAALYDYAGMTLKVDADNMQWVSELVGGPDDDTKAFKTLPFETPWRTVQVAEKATDLIASKLILNLNEPNQLGDVSWFTPTKYMGIWWEMHLGKSTWDMASGKHGATTENAKRYIDFCAENGIGALLVEGWNTGWERWIGFPDREGVFDFVTPYADYDIQEVVAYGKEKGVNIIMHHETSAAPRTYEQQLDTAFALCESLGIHAVKTGYVGPIIPEGIRHHGQWMVNHYQKVVETAAKHQVAVNAHEPIKATGKRRTWPNIIAREGLRGQEFNAWSVDMNPPEHTLIVPFTRMLGGPIDFTPGIFNIKFDEYKPDNQVNTTLAKQLSLYVLLYSPVQMAADLPEFYQGQPAFQFIRDVAVDWDESVMLNGEVGDYLTIARKERDGDRWFLGSATDEEGRSFSVTLDFLDPDKTYKAITYCDGKDAHWDDNPLAIDIKEQVVDATTELPIVLAPGGGAAVSFEPINE